MKEPWRGKPCAVCGKTSGYFQRVTYEGAPEGGTPVHMDCIGKFFAAMDKRTVEDEWREFPPRRSFQSAAGVIMSARELTFPASRLKEPCSPQGGRSRRSDDGSGRSASGGGGSR